MKNAFKTLFLAASIISIISCSKRNPPVNDDAESGKANVDHLSSFHSNKGPGEKASSPTAIVPKPVPERLQKLLTTPWDAPPSGWFVTLKAEDREILLSAYRAQTQLTNKHAITMALGFVGDAETVRELQNTLLHFPADHVLNGSENVVMLCTLGALGHLAGENDDALQLLIKATDPWFWKQEIPWRTESGEDQYRIFPGEALRALATSRRPEANEVFERIKQQPAVSDARGSGWTFESLLVDAAFYRDLIQQRGWERYKMVYGSEEVLTEWDWWKRTANGKQWVQWVFEWRKEHPEYKSWR